jgi:hypothetical protein
MSDEKFEEFLQQHAPDYNRPGEAPREEMWRVISKARSKPKKSWVRYTPWIGMAATLLLGVGIGRYVQQTPTTAPAPAPTSIAKAPLPAVTEAPTEERAPDAIVPTPVTRRPAAAPSPRREAVDLASSLTPVNQASREHLGRAEALISVIAATPADAVMDSLTGRWARDMLTNTRLLLDSPAGDDPSRRQLLEDLETVLVLLVQRSGAAVEERALLDRSLQRTQLLTRLRSGAAGG